MNNHWEDHGVTYSVDSEWEDEKLNIPRAVFRFCGENPRPYRDAKTIMGEPTQVIQPWMFGVPESKATCLWLVGLPPLVQTDTVKLPRDKKKAQRLHWMSPGPNRARERSRTFPPIADAMAEQWGH